MPGKTLIEVRDPRSKWPNGAAINQPIGWVEPMRSPSHIAILSMGFASTFALLSFGGRDRSTHPTGCYPKLRNSGEGRTDKTVMCFAILAPQRLHTGAWIKNGAGNAFLAFSRLLHQLR